MQRTPMEVIKRGFEQRVNFYGSLESCCCSESEIEEFGCCIDRKLSTLTGPAKTNLTNDDVFSAPLSFLPSSDNDVFSVPSSFLPSSNNDDDDSDNRGRSSGVVSGSSS